MPTSRAADKVGPRQTSLAAAVVPPAAPLRELASRFGSFANTVQTRMDTSAGTNGMLGGTLQAQVERALAQVLRQPGAIGSNGAGAMATAAGAAATAPALAPQQAALVRETRLVGGDLTSTLDTLRPLSTFADPGDVAALASVIRAETQGLLQEFSRSTLLPRLQRVRVLFGGLMGWNPGGPQPAGTPPAPPAGTGDIGSYLTLLNLGGPLVPTVAVEEQLASQSVLAADAAELQRLWMAFAANQTVPTIPPMTMPILWEAGLDAVGAVPRAWTQSGLGSGLGPRLALGPTMGLGPASAQTDWRLAVVQTPPVNPTLSYAERLIITDVLLPVLTDDARRVAAALDAIGISPGELESTFLTLNSYVDSDLLPNPPQSIPVPTTVTDILDWASTLTDATSRDTLRNGGQLGLNLLADQADELFWLVLAMLDPSAAAQMMELGDAQVQQELLSFARDLNGLANLAL